MDIIEENNFKNIQLNSGNFGVIYSSTFAIFIFVDCLVSLVISSLIFFRSVIKVENEDLAFNILHGWGILLYTLFPFLGNMTAKR
jgi:hypothetical protein